MNEIWCGVCENGKYGSNCLTCKDARAWEAAVTNQWLTIVAGEWYNGDDDTIKERLKTYVQR